MKKALFLIFILFVFNLQFAFCATDEGYGEDQTALGQFVDSFENANNITVIDDLIVNMTLDCVELNYTFGGVKIYENFTDYTQVEPDNRVDVINDTHIAHLARRDEDSYLYYNYGTDYFDDFTHQVIFEADYLSVNCIGYIWMVSDGLDDAVGLDVSNNNYLGLHVYIHATLGNGLQLVEVDAGTYYSNVSYGLSANTLYYLNISKYGTELDVYVYDDSAMTNLVDTLSRTLQHDYKLEYIFGCNTANTGNAIVVNTDVYFLWIGETTEGYEAEGYFTTEDYLNDTICNGSSLALMVNASIPANTDIQVQFSDDNATWGDWEGTPLDSNILSGGFETIDLRYLNYTDIYFMFNFSTTDGSVTPRLYQARLISTIGVGGAGPSGGGGIGIIMLILICIPLIILLGWGLKKR